MVYKLICVLFDLRSKIKMFSQMFCRVSCCATEVRNCPHLAAAAELDLKLVLSSTPDVLDTVLDVLVASVLQGLVLK